jgi:hypothetical protein
MPSIELDENTPVGSAFAPASSASRPPTPAPRPAPVPTPVPAPAFEPTRPPLAKHRPQNTLVSNRDESDELRRHIRTPGIPAVEEEMELEAIDELDHPTQAKIVPGARQDTRAPEPVFEPEAPAATEVEVPIDIEVAPGTTRISLNIKLMLSLRRR